VIVRWLIRDPRHLHAPVGFPGLAAIGGQRLFPTRAGRGDVRPDESRQHRLAFVFVRAFETTDAVVERADHGRFQHAAAIARPVQTPFLRLPIEQAQGHAAKIAVPVTFEAVDIANAAEDRRAFANGVELLPIGTADQALLQPFIVDFPAPKPEIEITRTVVDYVRSIRRGSPRDVITVFIPEYVVGHWWEHLLHNQSALRLKGRLLFTPGVMVVSVPWQLKSSIGATEPLDGSTPEAKPPAA